MKVLRFFQKLVLPKRKFSLPKSWFVDRTNEYEFVEENLKNLQDEMHPVISSIPSIFDHLCILIVRILGWPEDIQLWHRRPWVGQVPWQLDHGLSPVCLQGWVHKLYILFNIPWVHWQNQVISRQFTVVQNPEQFHFRSLFPAYLKLAEDKPGFGGLSKSFRWKHKFDHFSKLFLVSCWSWPDQRSFPANFDQIQL